MRPDKPCVHGIAVAAPCYDCCEAHNAELVEALRNVALQCGSYMCEGDDGPVIRCLYCGGENDQPCIACQINTFLGETEYVGKGAKCDRDYLVRKGWRDDE